MHDAINLTICAIEAIFMGSCGFLFSTWIRAEPNTKKVLKMLDKIAVDGKVDLKEAKDIIAREFCGELGSSFDD